MGREQLMTQLIALRQKLLAVYQLAISAPSVNPVAADLVNLLSISDAACVGSVDALAAQYQRMEVARPLGTQLAMTAPLRRRVVRVPTRAVASSRVGIASASPDVPEAQFCPYALEPRGNPRRALQDRWHKDEK